MPFVLGILKESKLHQEKHCTRTLGGIHSLYSFLHNLQRQRGHHLRQHTSSSSFVLVLASSTSGEKKTRGLICQSNLGLSASTKQGFKTCLMWFHTSDRLNQHSMPF